MIIRFSSIVLSLSLLLSSGQELSETERSNLLKIVEALKYRKVSQNNAELSRALSAFRTGASSDTAAFDLYMECQKRLMKQGKKISPGDLNDKLRAIREKTTTSDKRALRHQLSWLVATIEAAIDPDIEVASVVKLEQILVNIVKETKALTKNSVKSLSSNPFDSVFAKAFEVSEFKPKEWASSPLDYDGLYYNLICEELIAREQYTEARTQWAKRITAERAVIAAYDKKVDTITKAGASTPEVQKFMETKAPRLKWRLEMDLYEAGDKRQALTEAYKILERYPQHKNYLEWVEWLTGALQPSEVSIDEE